MGETIGKYELIKPLTNTNAGNCRWTFGRRDGEEFFIKELLTPVYPSDDQGLSEATLQRKRKLCDDFEMERLLVFRALNKCSDGNLLRIEHFFRYGTKYYLVTKKVCDKGSEYLASQDLGMRIRACQILAHSVAAMHGAGLVHGDLKLSNIAFYETWPSGSLSAKIIDVDGCYWAAQPPTDPDSVMTDQVYMAPEVFLLICNEEGVIGQPADVFSLALCMHAIVAGEPPRHDGYRYAYQAVLDGGSLGLSPRLPEWFRRILKQMLLLNPEKRPGMDSVFSAIKHANPAELEGEDAPDGGHVGKPEVKPEDHPTAKGGSGKIKGDNRLWGNSSGGAKPPEEAGRERGKPLPVDKNYWFSAPGDL